MDILEYKEEIVKLDTKPDKLDIIYATLGLCGEASEVTEKYQNYTRGNQIKVVDEVTRESIAKELGDVLWYMTRILHILGANIDKDLQHPVFPVLTDPSLVAFNLQMKAGQVAEIVKKSIRENALSTNGNVIVMKPDEAMIIDKINTMITMLQVLSSGITLSLSEVAKINLEKIKSRTKRGVLSGRGDNR